jgi:hypothetical protein
LRFPDELVTYPEAPGSRRPVVIVPVVMVIVVNINPLMNMNVCLRCPQNMCRA